MLQAAVIHDVYAIRVVGTLNYMPAKLTRNASRGHTWCEPTLYGGPFGARFFMSYKAACKAISAWKKGTCEISRSRSYSTFGDDDEVSLLWQKVEARTLVELEVVKFCLVELPAEEI